MPFSAGWRPNPSGDRATVRGGLAPAIAGVATLALSAVVLVTGAGGRRGVAVVLVAIAVAALLLVRLAASLHRSVLRTRELDRTNADLVHRATVDPVTDLLNHRATMDRLGEEFARARRFGQPVSLCFLDVDSFKQVNDAFGHQTGDRVLAHIGGAIRGAARAMDIVGRYGGEEFVVIVPGATAAQAAVAAERIRQTVAHRPFRIDDGTDLRLSVSIGVAAFPEHAGDRDELLRCADLALYAAKHSGRNQVQPFDPATHPAAAGPPSFAAARDLTRLVETRDPAAQHHAVQVGLYAAGLAETVGLSNSQVARIERAALLHNIGKVAIPESILTKTDPLSERERDALRRHPVIGAAIVARVPGETDLADLVRHHHERWDGSGYPDGLRGEAIPIGARIIAIADAYQAMTKPRSFRPELTQPAAIAEIRRCAGTHFDPALVEPFIALVTGADATAAAVRLPPRSIGPLAPVPRLAPPPGDGTTPPIVGPWAHDREKTIGTSSVAD